MAHRILTSLVGIDATFSSTLSLTSLAGVGNRMLIVNSAGTVSTQAIPTGTVTSVGLSMPSAFTVTNSPVTGAGTLTVTGAGSTLQYIDGTGALQTFPTTLPSTKVQHQVKAGVAINKGQAVYVTSADGTNMIVGLASNDTEATSSKTMGLLDATVSINGFANVVTEGLLAGLDTTAATSAGDPVWLGTNGNLLYGMANKPSAPSHMVFIGIVTRINLNNGEIFVKVQNGFELQELHNVQITSTPADNTVLSYETSSSLYKMKSIATLLGYTPVSGTGTTNYISKFTGSTALGSSVIYDDGTNIGVGTTSPSFKTQISSAAGNSTSISTIASTNYGLVIQNTTNVLGTYTGIGFMNPFDTQGYIAVQQASTGYGAGGNMIFAVRPSGGGTVMTERMRIASTGNVLIGTTTDSGYLLDAAGVIRANTATEKALRVENTNGNYIELTVGAGSALGAGVGGIYFNGSPYYAFGGSANIWYVSYHRVANNAQTFQFYGGYGSTTLGNSIYLGSNTVTGGAFTATSGTQNTVSIGAESNAVWQPASGTAVYNLLNITPRINTSGTYAGTVRGLYINPTLTSTTGTTFRAIETVSGDVYLGSTSGSVGIGIAPSSNDILSVGGNINLGAYKLYNGAASDSAGLWFNSNVTNISGYSGISFRSSAAGIQVQSIRMSIFPTGNVAIGTTTDAGYKLDINGTARVQGTLAFNNGNTYVSNNSNNIWIAAVNSTANDIALIPGQQVNVSNTGTYTAQTTALVQIDSTTKGFLPPRMTATQRGAISTPAVGLVVYQTDGVEGLYVNTSGGWKSLTMV